MDNSNITVWRKYLIDQMMERLNYEPREAGDLVDRWLNSVTRDGRDGQDTIGSLKHLRKRSSRTAAAA